MGRAQGRWGWAVPRASGGLGGSSMEGWGARANRENHALEMGSLGLVLSSGQPAPRPSQESGMREGVGSADTFIA